METRVNSQLKDFQIATVNYVFQRFTDEVNPCNRFLIADEVGLGKTLVARGIIKEFHDYFKKRQKPVFNVIYICSNQSIASQNISRLNIERQGGYSPTRIDRLNDLAITKIDANNRSYLTLIALSPNTSFNVSSGGGTARERAIIFHALCCHKELSQTRNQLKKLFRLDVGEEGWNELTATDSWIKASLRQEIVLKFNSTLNSESEIFNQLLVACDDRFNISESRNYRRLIGGLRKILGSVCVEYLDPDLIIMDEFQRFKKLIDMDDDSETKMITESLFTDNQIKILLLSATPYKMFALQTEEDDGESHFEEFKFIINFLLNSDEKTEQFLDAWEAYSKSLLHLQERNWEIIKVQKKRVEALLRSVIARTERITVSDDKNTLVRPSGSKHLLIKSTDIKTFIAADSVAAIMKDVNSPVEYCKSSPFPFSFMEGYQLQRIARREIANGNEEIVEALKNNKNAFLPIDTINDFKAIENANAKLSYLLNDTLYNGGSDLLWIPPSLPYYEFEAAYKGKESYSKTLVFSSWVMVPKMIAGLASYECERLTIGDPKSIENSEERSERKYFQTGSERHPKARLRFSSGYHKYSSLSHYALLYPSMTLSELWQPADKTQNLDQLLNELSIEIKSLIHQISISEFITEPQKNDDDQWALIYMILLDRKHNKEKIAKLIDFENNFDWEWFKADEDNTNANDYYEKVFGDILFAKQPPNLSAPLLAMRGKPEDPVTFFLRELSLGHPPADIANQLAYLTIASPAICSYRLLNAFASHNQQLNYISFFGAFKIADSFRKFFNVSENIAVIDKYPTFDSYWKNVLAYSASGNLQAMLDEFASAIVDHYGLWNYSPGDKLNKMVDLISDKLRLRTVTITGHTYESFVMDKKPKHFRCHFAVALNQSIVNEKDVMRSDDVRDSFNSPFRPFILATTSIGQEGLDFHLYCRKILHWNLPANPVDFEQREGRINRFKNLAIRQNLAIKYRSKLQDVDSATVWNQLFQLAVEFEKGKKSDLVPYWHVEPQNIFIERQVPTIPYSKEVKKLKNLLRTISVYRIALGQPRQEELVKHLIENFDEQEIEKVQNELLINLSPYGSL